MMMNLKYFLLIILEKTLENNFLHVSPPLTGQAIWRVVYTFVYTLSSSNCCNCVITCRSPLMPVKRKHWQSRAGGANLMEWSVVSYCWRGETRVAAILTMRALTSSGSRSSNPVALMMNGSKSLKPSAKAYMAATRRRGSISFVKAACHNAPEPGMPIE